MIKKVVLDANIFVSALLVSDSNAAKILDLARAGELELLISPGILEEIARVLQYPKLKKRHRRTPRELRAFLKEFAEFATVVAGESKIEAVKADPDDDKYLACAVEGQADFIISGDRHLTDLGVFRGIRIVSPGEFLELVGKERF
jgi:putative PIN family toxin of toxin-antitoxin system